jgi:hypothetical protein
MGASKKHPCLCKTRVQFNFWGYSMLLRTKKTPKILHKGVSKEEKEKEKKHEPGLIVCTSSTYQKLHKGGFIRLLFRSGDPFWREMQAAGKGGNT